MPPILVGKYFLRRQGRSTRKVCAFRLPDYFCAMSRITSFLRSSGRTYARQRRPSATFTPEVPQNEGAFRLFHVTAPPGSILYRFAPAAGASRHMTGHFLPGVMF